MKHGRREPRQEHPGIYAIVREQSSGAVELELDDPAARLTYRLSREQWSDLCGKASRGEVEITRSPDGDEKLLLLRYDPTTGEPPRGAYTEIDLVELARQDPLFRRTLDGVQPPGALLASFLAWFPKKQSGEIFGQIVADMREEWSEAIANDDQKAARRIQLRGYLAFSIALIVWMARGVFKLLSFAKAIEELSKR